MALRIWECRIVGYQLSWLCSSFSFICLDNFEHIHISLFLKPKEAPAATQNTLKSFNKCVASHYDSKRAHAPLICKVDMCKYENIMKHRCIMCRHSPSWEGIASARPYVSFCASGKILASNQNADASICMGYIHGLTANESAWTTYHSIRSLLSTSTAPAQDILFPCFQLRDYVTIQTLKQLDTVNVKLKWINLIV